MVLHFFFFLLGAENMITKDNKDNKREKWFSPFHFKGREFIHN